MRLFLICSLLCAAGLAQTGPARPNSASPRRQSSTAIAVPHLEARVRQAGLTASHISSPAARYIIESVSGGVGLIDCNNDGKLDIITVNGSDVARFRDHGGGP